LRSTPSRTSLPETAREDRMQSAPRPNLVSLSEVAAIAGRSYSWARDRTVDGTFAYVLQGRRVYIPAYSLAAYLRQRAPRPGPRLRLVVDNTK
jgi:hypothetical protein